MRRTDLTKPKTFSPHSSESVSILLSALGSVTNSCMLDRQKKPEWITSGLITLQHVYAQHKCLLSFRPPSCTDLLMLRGFEVAHHPINLVTICKSASAAQAARHRACAEGADLAGPARPTASENIKTIKTDPEPIGISTAYLKWTVDGSVFICFLLQEHNLAYHQVLDHYFPDSFSTRSFMDRETLKARLAGSLRLFWWSWERWKDNRGAGLQQNAGQPWNTMCFHGSSIRFFRRGFLGRASDYRKEFERE